MAIDIITKLYIPMIIVPCLVAGYILKKWIKDVDNKWIPTILTFLGLALGVLYLGTTIENAIKGMVSGLASIGFYEFFRNIIERKGEK